MTEALDRADAFYERNREMVQRLSADIELRDLSREWIRRGVPYEYSYHFTWLGRPIIQYPQDVVAIQEILWRVQPDLVVETGVAHGGSLVLSASILELLGGGGRVLGVDIDVRRHNREAIESHPLSHRISLIEGSSVDEGVVQQVREEASAAERVLVILDSNHEHDHVLRELELYSPLVTVGSYLVVFDTIVEFMSEKAFSDRPWGVGRNPYTAVRAFLSTSDRFTVDEDFDHKLLVTAAPGGYLRCVR